MRRCVAVVVLVLAMVCAPVAQAAAAGGTGVAIDGSTATLTVRMDVCCVRTAQDANIWAPIFRALSRAAESIWNDQLADLSVCGGFKLKVKIDEKILREGDARRSDAHQVKLDFTESGRSTVDDPVGGKWDDTTSGLTKSLTANWFLPDMDQRTVAHEVGHLLGLGDDYSDAAKGSGSDLETVSIPLPGRWGTLMDTRKGKVDDQVDQLLADRVADIIARAGHNIPRCQVWGGTAKSFVTDTAPGANPCGNPHILDATVRLVVAGDGTVTGAMDTTGCNVSVAHADFTGTSTDKGFLFPALVIYTNGEMIPKVTPKHAEATLTNVQTEWVTWSTNWDLNCQTCG